jgi:hypothetical protein
MNTMRCLFLVLMAAWMVSSAQAADEPVSSRTYARWKHGPPSDPGYFPIAVWLQSPENASKYRAIGVNLYVGLWNGPTDDQLARLKAAGMSVICEQNAVGLAHKDDPVIVGWMHGDEPDNAQPVTDPATGKSGYGPCIPPPRIVADYAKLRAADPTRPIMLNLGQGVANDEWIGRGSGAKLDDYATYVQGSDIVSFDVYPVTGLPKPDSENYLWYVPKGVDRLVKWTQGRKPVWNCIECTAIDGGKKATPHQVRAEVWMALIHGSKGLIYFVHQFKPTFNEHALLDDAAMRTAVTAIDRQIHALAPVLNSPAPADAAAVKSASEHVPIDLMVRRHGGATYIFAAGMRNDATRGTFQVPGSSDSGAVEVLGENRTLPLQNGRFEDDFRPYDVHLYRIGRDAAAGKSEP